MFILSNKTNLSARSASHVTDKVSDGRYNDAAHDA